ncbi:hypothetical protein F5146DRAFT_1020387 [Armillaria mellea]|nr:hypothetical protein F5146DRAFT_1020387 [Armillaria mellea]
MKLFLLAAAFASVASAHFQLQFPDPRGAFNEDNEPTFCDGYTSVAQNRTEFPLDSGFFSLNSEHPSWTAAVYLSTSSNPTSFDDFKQIVPFFQMQGEGIYCLPLNLSATNATGLTNEQNVTIQILYNGGDSQLYQVLNFSLSQSIDATCTNATSTSTNSTSNSTDSGSGSSSGSGPAPLASSLSLSGLVVCIVGTMAFFFM